jgi:hypothetical protein
VWAEGEGGVGREDGLEAFVFVFGDEEAEEEDRELVP